MIRLVRDENARLQDMTRDQEAELFELQAQCTAQEEELSEMIEKIKFLKRQLTEPEEDLHKTNFQWAALQQRFANLKNELENDFTPRVVWTAKKGKSYHTSLECQGLGSADREQLKLGSLRILRYRGPP